MILITLFVSYYGSTWQEVPPLHNYSVIDMLNKEGLNDTDGTQLPRATGTLKEMVLCHCSIYSIIFC